MGYFCRNDFSAQAARYMDRDIIGLSVTVPLKIRAIVKSLVLKNTISYLKNYFNSIDVCVEKFDTKCNYDFFLKNPSIIEKTNDYNLDYAIDRISEIAIRFILLHEFMHIAAGHTRWINENFSISEIHDGENLQKDNFLSEKITKVQKKSLEWDADCRAVEILTSSTVNSKEVYNNNGSFLYRIDPYGPFGEWKQSIYFEAVALLVCYIFMYNSNNSNPKNTHPDNSLRFIWSILHISDTLFRWSKVPLETSLTISFTAVRDVQDYLNAMQGNSINFISNFSDQSIQNAISEEEILREALKNMHSMGLKSLY